MTAIGPAVLNQLLFKSVPYDTDRDFAPVILVGELPQLIVTEPARSRRCKTWSTSAGTIPAS